MDFEEIAHAGGKVTFKNGAVSYLHTKATPVKVLGLCFSQNGHALGWYSFGLSSHPLHSIVVMIPTDCEGFWEFNCPKCAKYFRSEIASEFLGCAYCPHQNFIWNFLTNNKIEFIRFYLEKVNESLRTQKSFFIDLDNIASHILSNQSIFKLSHERQQNKIKCSDPSCRNVYDILGEYGGCPICRHRNNHSVLLEKQTKLSGKPEDQLNGVFEIFEGMANDIKENIIVNIPSTHERQKQIKSLSFQRYDDLDRLNAAFGINIFKGLKPMDKKLIKRMLQVRHLKVHRNLIVDQKYIEETEDDKVRIGQKLTVAQSDIEELKKLITTLSMNINEATNEIMTAFNQIH